MNTMDRHEQLKRFLGPLYGGQAIFARFYPDAPVADADVVDTEAASQEGADGSPPEDPAPAPSDETILSSAGLVNQDGTFVKEWYNSDKLPEEVRGSDALKPIKDISGLSKSYVSTKKMVGTDKLSLPGKDAKPEDWQAVLEKIGEANPELARPKTAEEYQIEVPEGMETIFTDERVANIRQTAHAMGLTQKQVSEYVRVETESVAKELEQFQLEEEKTRDEDNLALKKEWGAAYDDRLHAANRLVAEAFGVNKSEQLEFLQEFGNNPRFIRFAANVGLKLNESTSLVAQLTSKTPHEAAARIKELQETPGYLNMGSDMTPDERRRITEEIREQNKLIHPD
jgi:hypothetical protein